MRSSKAAAATEPARMYARRTSSWRRVGRCLAISQPSSTQRATISPRGSRSRARIEAGTAGGSSWRYPACPDHLSSVERVELSASRNRAHGPRQQGSPDTAPCARATAAWVGRYTPGTTLGSATVWYPSSVSRRVVPKVGFEPTRGCPQRFLRLDRTVRRRPRSTHPRSGRPSWRNPWPR